MTTKSPGWFAEQRRAWQSDWESLTERGSDHLPGWVERHPVFAGCADLDDILDAIRGEPDTGLGALIAEDQAGCPLAARVVLESMRPKMLRMAYADPHAEPADYLAHLWLVIRRYPLHRRAERIAANLALDTLKAVKSEQDDHLLPLESDRLDQLQTRADLTWPQTSLTVRSVLQTAEQLGLIDRLTRVVMCSVYADGLPGRRAASRHNIGHNALRQRCSSAMRTLADHAEELVAAA